jgi:hypothetical protein
MEVGVDSSRISCKIYTLTFITITPLLLFLSLRIGYHFQYQSVKYSQAHC